MIWYDKYAMWSHRHAPVMRHAAAFWTERAGTEAHQKSQRNGESWQGSALHVGGDSAREARPTLPAAMCCSEFGVLATD